MPRDNQQFITQKQDLKERGYTQFTTAELVELRYFKSMVSTFTGKRYTCMEGLSMGSSLLYIVACIFMENFDNFIPIWSVTLSNTLKMSTKPGKFSMNGKPKLEM